MSGEAYVDVLRECLSCEWFERCPKSVLPGTVACELFKLSVAMGETRITLLTEVISMFDRRRKWLWAAVYIAGVVTGILLVLAFQGKL